MAPRQAKKGDPKKSTDSAAVKEPTRRLSRDDREAQIVQAAGDVVAAF